MRYLWIDLPAITDKMAAAGGGVAGPSKKRICKRGDPNLASMILEALENGDVSDISELDDNDEPGVHEGLDDEITSDIEVVDESEKQSFGDEEGDADDSNETMNSMNLTQRMHIKWSKRKTFFKPQSTEWFPPTNADIQITRPFTPLEYFSRYIPSSLLERMCEMTNIYALQRDANFQPCTTKEIEILIGLHIIMGTLKFPRVGLYWDAALGLDVFLNSMQRIRFFKLRTNLHLVNNLDKEENNQDKFWKVRPIYDSIKKLCTELKLEQRLCVDEQMVPFKGNCAAKQYIKNKPHKWGIKIFVLCGESGIAYDFLIYQGKTTGIDEDLKQLGHGAGVVLQLSKRITVTGTNGHQLFFDNFFTSYNLLQALKSSNILAVGTARLNRFASPPFISDKEMKKKPRGNMEEVFSQDGDCVAVKWLDNNPVNLASNFIGIGTADTARRWDKSKKTYIDVPRPEIVKLYNSSMGGVDKLDFLISLYRIFIRSKKWTLRMIFHAIDLAITNSWLEYKTDAEICKIPKKNVMDLLHFRMFISEGLTKRGQVNPARKRGRPSAGEAPAPVCDDKRKRMERAPVSEVRNDGVDHLPVHNNQKEAGRCKMPNCKGKSHFRCEKCQIHLCLSKDRNCFRSFHIRV